MKNIKKIITKYNKNKFIIIITFLVIIILWLLNLIIIPIFYKNKLDQGLFGDMFGATNALFSGFALAGIIYAIILQKQELNLQRKELELTREELKRSAIAQEESHKELSKQAASLKATAKLNGLSAILNHYDKISDRLLGRGLTGQSDELVEQIKEIIRGK